MATLNRRKIRNAHVIFDVMYGFIPITEWEERIISSPFYQRLRWIKQLGFANYIFPGAEHNRFAHAIGVMHSMDQMLRAMGLSVPDEELHNPKATSEAAMLHKSLRLAALLHDIGTFPFSHAVENAYIRHGNNDQLTLGAKNLTNSHEHLGAFIIKNTNYEGGITQILERYNLDPQLISRIIKGDSKYLIANQLMHSDLDADRMDYLMRDSHYTGIKYGQFDREYILANLVTYEPSPGQLSFGVRESAAHAVEDFLIARFSWYSQVIKNPGSAKFDIMSTHVTQAFLEAGWFHSFQDLLGMVESRDERFFWWNDIYFMSRAQEVRTSGKIRDPRVAELTEMLLYRKAPKTLSHPLFEHRILPVDPEDRGRKVAVRKIEQFVGELKDTLKRYGRGDEWLLLDIPEKDVVFTTGLGKLKKKTKKGESVYQMRDPVRVLSRKGEPKLLVEVESSLMRVLSGYTNFVPNVYANDSALTLLRRKKIL